MKKSEVTQPIAMASAFAENVYSSTSTGNFEIPAATSSAADDTCVLDNGFLPITSTALDDSGIAPERKNFNGMFYLSTDQRCYLQNGGFITFNPEVATAIGGYPEGAVLDYVQGSNFYKVISLIDDNTNNFIANPALINNTAWAFLNLGDGANQDLSNLSATGEKHFLNKNQVSNVITELPARIFYDFDTNGHIQLKAGSEVFINNGDGYASYILSQNSSYSAGSLWTTDSSRVVLAVYVPDSNSLECASWNYVTHSASAPTAFQGNCALWDDTSSNQLKVTYDNGANWHICSLPVFIGYPTSPGGWSGHIANVCNAFGFFGQKTFVLPGVKALFANGHNSDGTLNNTAVTTSQVKINDLSGQSAVLAIFQGEPENLNISGFGNYNWFEGATGMLTPVPTNVYYYNTTDNAVYLTSDSGVNWNLRKRILLGKISKADNTSNIEAMSITTKPVRLLNDNDKFEIVYSMMPQWNAGISIPWASLVAGYIAPRNGFISMTAYPPADRKDQFIYVNNISINMCFSGPKDDADKVNISFPVSQGDIIRVTNSSYTPRYFDCGFRPLRGTSFNFN